MRVVPKPSLTGVFIRGGKPLPRDTQTDRGNGSPKKMEAEVGVMHCKVRNCGQGSGSHQEL
jgi:hypothetical protein